MAIGQCETCGAKLAPADTAPHCRVCRGTSVTAVVDNLPAATASGSDNSNATTVTSETAELLFSPSDNTASMDSVPLPSQLRPGSQSGLARVKYFGDYELLSEIARGGMGVVYQARQITLNRLVAVKMILAGEMASPLVIKRFRHEAEAAANLDYPGIVPIYEIGEHDGLHYFSMKFVEGRSLSAAVGELMHNPRKAARIVAATARAIYHAHQRGVLHRDLKPSNVLLDHDDMPHVTDFGIAKVLDAADGLTFSGAVMGTPSYMSPEQAEGKSRELTVAADVWGLGAILYDCITGKPPFRSTSAMQVINLVRTAEPEPPQRLNPDAPDDLALITMKCLQKPPELRYATALELAEDLERWLRGEPVIAHPLSRPQKLVLWANRHPLVAALTAALATSFVLGVIGITWQWRNAVRAYKEADFSRTLADNRAQELEHTLYKSQVTRSRMLLKSSDASAAEELLWQTHDTRPPNATPLSHWALRELYYAFPRARLLSILAAELGTDPTGTTVTVMQFGQFTILNPETYTTNVVLGVGTQLIYGPALSRDGKHAAAADAVTAHLCTWALDTANRAPSCFPISQNAPGQVMLEAPALAFLEQGLLSVTKHSAMLTDTHSHTLRAELRDAVHSSVKTIGTLGDGSAMLARSTLDHSLVIVMPGSSGNSLTTAGLNVTDIGKLTLGVNTPDAEALHTIAACVTADGSGLLAQVDGGLLKHWNLKSGNLLSQTTATIADLSSLAISADGTRSAGISGADGWIWDIPTLQLSHSFKILGGGGLNGVFAPRAGQLLISEGSLRVGVYDPGNGLEIIKPESAVMTIVAAALPSTGPLYLSVQKAGVESWESAVKRELPAADGRGNHARVRTMAAARNGDVLAAGIENNPGTAVELHFAERLNRIPIIIPLTSDASGTFSCAAVSP